MDEAEAPFNKIAKAIGFVCIYWTEIEQVIHDIILHTSVCLEPSFESEQAWEILHLTLTNEDIRQKIATAKILAHKIDMKESPDFYERATQLLNYVDNDLRPVRNRYIHDYWSQEGEEIVRSQMGAKIERIQSRQRALRIWTTKRFKDLSAIEMFGNNLEMTYDDLVTLDNHIAWLTSLRDLPLTELQPLPPVWPSSSHRDWQEPSKPKARP